jgi:hypothetical protein
VYENFIKEDFDNHSEEYRKIHKNNDTIGLLNTQLRYTWKIIENALLNLRLSD